MRIKYIAALVAAAAVAAPAQAQVRTQAHAQQQDRMQQHVQQLTTQIKQMDQVRARLHQLEQNCTQQLQQVQDRDRLREQTRLRDMARDMDGVVGQMKQNMERTRAMADNPLFKQDPELQREMEQLREHWRIMGEQLDKGVQSMERLHNRLHVGQ